MTNLVHVERLGLVVEQWGQTRRHRGWHDVLVAWAEVQQLYWERTQDIGWWSSERASVSLLSNAIWRCEGAALQEYRDTKEGEDGSPYAGRPDLYAVLHSAQDPADPQEPQKIAYIAEAKQCYPLLLDDRAERLITRHFEAARADGAKNQSPDGETRVAITFASHFCSAEENPTERLDSIWTKGLPSVQKVVTAGFAAHLLPVGRWKNFGIKDTLWEPSKLLYPGCSLLVGFLDS